MKTLTKLSIFILLMQTFLHSENLTSKYKQMMSAPVSDTVVSPAEKNVEKKKETNSNVNYNIENEIKKIEALKQGTFEASRDFIERRNGAILELSNKIKFFAQNATKEYSAGTLKMKSYDADNEIMKLSLAWNPELKTIFPEIDKLETVYLNISRDDAKQLFEKEDIHYFHINMTYRYNKLTVSKMTIYDKFELYKPAVKKPVKQSVKKVETFTKRPTSVPTYQKRTAASCDEYVVNIAQLNIRSYPDKGNNIIGAVYRGNRVCVYEYSGKWRRIGNGWISGKYLVRKISHSTRKFGVVYGLDPRGDGFLSIRRKPKSVEIGRLYNGEKVEILGRKGKWYKVKKLSTGLVGWSHSKWISL